MDQSPFFTFWICESNANVWKEIDQSVQFSLKQSPTAFRFRWKYLLAVWIRIFNFIFNSFCHLSLPIKTASIEPLFSLPGKASSSSAFPSFFATSSSRSGFRSSSLSSPLSSSFLTSWAGSFTFSTESSLLPLSSSLAISSPSSSYCCSSFTSRGSLIYKGTLLSCLNTFSGKAAGNSHYLRL